MPELPSSWNLWGGDGLSLADPWLLLALPAVWGLFWRSRRRGGSALYSSASLLDDLPVTPAQRVAPLWPWVRVLGLSVLAVALARPRWGTTTEVDDSRGVAIEMCIDRSRSMLAEDFRIAGRPVNRLVAVKQVFREFVQARPDDLIGLIGFGGFADALCPPTLDHELLLERLEDVQIPQPIRDGLGRVLNADILEQEGATAIGDALSLGVARLRHVPAESRVLILLSDGANTAGVVSPEDAAEAAKEFGIRVHTIGVGTTEGTVLPPGAFGLRIAPRQVARLDETALRGIAAATGGAYFNAADSEELLRVYAAIDSLEKSDLQGRTFVRYREWFPPLVLAGMLLVLLETIARATRWRSLTDA